MVSGSWLMAQGSPAGALGRRGWGGVGGGPPGQAPLSHEP